MSEKKVDEDWKRRAREEKEKMSKEVHEHAAEPPAASFPMIISSFVAQALISMGDMPNPIDGQRHIDLESAKFSIDVLQILSDKTKGNLADDEKKMLDGALYDLRMRYVERSS